MRVSVYVPKISEEKDKQVHGRLRALFCTHAGGFTIYPSCTGHWLDDKEQEVIDHVVVYETYAQEDKENLLLKNLAVELLVIRELLNQDSIAYTIDNQIYFI